MDVVSLLLQANKFGLDGLAWFLGVVFVGLLAFP